jgi:putative ABC transport system permease protein
MMWVVLACRNAIANTRRSLLTLFSLCVATAVLLLFAAYVNSTRVALQYALVHGGYGHFQISGKGGFDDTAENPLQFGLTPQQVAALEKAADALPEVRRVVPRLSFGGLISNGGQTVPFSGTGVDAGAEAAAFGRAHVIVAGEPLSPASPGDGVILGRGLARLLGVKPGDSVTIMSSTVSGALNVIDVVVVGVETTGVAETDRMLVRARIETVQALLGTDKISSLVILLDEDRHTNAIAQRLTQTTPGLEARSWIQLAPIFRQVIGMYESLFKAVFAFIVVITLMGLGVTILTSVLERTRDIGVMRALGISRNLVRWMFVLEGLALATAGVIIGSVLAVFGCLILNQARIMLPPPPGRLQGYPLSFLWDWPAAAAITLCIVGMSVLVAWLASGRISRLDVTDALSTT